MRESLKSYILGISFYYNKQCCMCLKYNLITFIGIWIIIISIYLLTNNSTRSNRCFDLLFSIYFSSTNVWGKNGSSIGEERGKSKFDLWGFWRLSDGCFLASKWNADIGKRGCKVSKSFIRQKNWMNTKNWSQKHFSKYCLEI